jgi:hypothetical protein
MSYSSEHGLGWFGKISLSHCSSTLASDELVDPDSESFKLTTGWLLMFGFISLGMVIFRFQELQVQMDQIKGGFL